MHALLAIRDTTLSLPVTMTANEKRVALLVVLPGDLERVQVELSWDELMLGAEMVETVRRGKLQG